MPTLLRNATPGPLSLPYPLRGSLAPGQAVVVSATKAQVLAGLGGHPLPGLQVTALPSGYSGPTDDVTHQGALVGPDPTRLPTSKIPFGTGSGIATNPGVTFDPTMNELTAANLVGGSLRVGPAPSGPGYPPPGDGGFDCDGTNPPTLRKLRILDQVTGQLRTLTVSNGVLVIT